MKVKLINIGRNKVNRTVNVEDIDEALNEAAKHLASSEYELVSNQKNDKLFYVFVGGFRNVGTLEIVN